MAVASGSRGLEAAVLLADGDAVRQRGPRRAARPRRAASVVHRGRPCRRHAGDARPLPERVRQLSARLAGRDSRPARGRPAPTQPSQRLRASYAALPAGAPVRLAKRTSNLFRPAAAPTRRASTSPGSTAWSRRRRGRTADVQGMCTYEDLVDATLPHGLIPLVVPQLRTITLGGAVTGLGIESTSFRSGLPHESVLEMDISPAPARSSPPGRATTCSTPSRTPTAPWATRPGCGSASRRCRAHVALRHLRFDDPGCSPRRSRRSSRPASTTGAGRRARRGGVRAGRALPDARDLGPTHADSGPTSDYTGQQIYYRSLQRAGHRPAHDARLPVALGHRLVLVLGRVRRAAPASSGGCGRGAGGARTSTTGWSRLDRRFGIADRLDRRAGRPQRERVIQDVEVPGRAAGRLPRRGSTTRSGCGRCGCAPWSRTGPGPPTRSSPAAPTSTSASGAPCTSARRPSTRR